MTPLQQDPSAQAPWARTMFGRPFIVLTPLLVVCGKASVTARDTRAHRTILRSESTMEWMPTIPGQEFHGRHAELALLRGELEHLSDGAEAVVIVEGAAGMGKSRLLAEVSTIARTLGIRVGTSAADSSDTVVELATLLAALFDGAEPLLDAHDFTTLHAQPEQRFWLLRDLQALLES